MSVSEETGKYRPIYFNGKINTPNFCWYCESIKPVLSFKSESSETLWARPEKKRKKSFNVHGDQRAWLFKACSSWSKLDEIPLICSRKLKSKVHPPGRGIHDSKEASHLQLRRCCGELLSVKRWTPLTWKFGRMFFPFPLPLRACEWSLIDERGC